jgi:ABC-2 type transport system permease protein
VFLVNPLVFISEAMRLAVTPEIPHMPAWLILSGLLATRSCSCSPGASAFQRRTVL